MSNWIAAAEAALLGRPTAGVEVDVLPRSTPPLLDAAGVRALVSPFIAAFLWAATVFRETQTHQTLDPLALLFRVLALALSVRALRLLIEFSARLRVRLSSGQYALALTRDGLLFRSPKGDVVVPREEILDVRARGDWTGKSERRWSDVYVVTHPDSPRTYLALPPLFEATPGALAETLMRWRGVLDPAPAADGGETEDDEPLATKLWERAARAERIAGVVAIPHGSAWLQRGPYASVLLGVAMLDGFLRVPAAARALFSQGPALVLLVALVLIPLGWIVFTRASLRSRQGLALVLTPRDLLVRSRAGLSRVAWSSVTRVEVASRTSWSILQGAHESRAVVVHRQREASIQCSEAFIKTPAEVVAALCDAYRKSLIRS
ncbi:MAG TPA: hypothetical protein VGI70_07705 [Polyangiales bacterium]|jgi:hypothetical protein